jgi:hypothetical protein
LFNNPLNGFGNPGKDSAVSARTTKSFQAGIYSVGGYSARAGTFRAQIIPTTAVPGLTGDGFDVPGSTIYSQLARHSHIRGRRSPFTAASGSCSDGSG